MVVAEIGDELAVGLHDFEVLRIHPDDALKIGMLPLDDFGFRFKDVAVDFVHFFAADVLQVVLGKLAGDQRVSGKTHKSAKIGRLELQVAQRGRRIFDDLFEHFAFGADFGLRDQLEFAGGFTVQAKFGQADGLLVAEMRAGLREILLALREMLNDLLGRKGRRRLRRRGIRGDPADIVLGRRSEGAIGFLRVKDGNKEQEYAGDQQRWPAFRGAAEQIRNQAGVGHYDLRCRNGGSAPPANFHPLQCNAEADACWKSRVAAPARKLWAQKLGTALEWNAL